ncbi:PiggyBac transposable element-derived protein 4-like [Plakobranchus ocellatus]|uniref:PiggyBac transposable element-derived protein 4-like n=1 Tax=Plakobranchus ocellatus TaxID=259542 RepID=A0AAV4DCB5_9GAST|nr:PiggyBac transposable element-derived protein 4-like [Plakobranchus ocellatus]
MLLKLKKADTTSVITNETLNLLRFYDKREVNILSTTHDDTIVATGKTDPVTFEYVIKLHAVADHNKFVGAVDGSNQDGVIQLIQEKNSEVLEEGFLPYVYAGSPEQLHTP